MRLHRKPSYTQPTYTKHVHVCMITVDLICVTSIAGMSVLYTVTNVLSDMYYARIGPHAMEYYLGMYTMVCEYVDYPFIVDIVKREYRQSIKNLCVRDIKCNLIINSLIINTAFMCESHRSLRIALKHVPSEYIQEPDCKHSRNSRPVGIIQKVTLRGYTKCFKVLLRRRTNHDSLLSHAIGYNRLDYVNLVLNAGRVNRQECQRLLNRAVQKKKYDIIHAFNRMGYY